MGVRQRTGGFMNSKGIFQKITDTKDLTVGGGSASAVAGAMGAGLIGMVSRLSAQKDWGLTPEEYMELGDRSDSLVKDLLLGSEEDTAAYCLIKAAYGMPKSTEVEKQERSKAIGLAGEKAASIPLENGFHCGKVAKIGKYLLGKSNANAESDLRIGIQLAELGIRGCAMNVEANLPLIKNPEAAETFKIRLAELKSQVEDSK